METHQETHQFFDLNSDNIESLLSSDPPLIEAIKELKSASDAIHRMGKVGVGSFYEYDRAWRDFLQAIDRTWNKVSARCKGERKWKRFQSQYEKARKNDELLKYLSQARNVSEHTISPVIKEWDANLKAKMSSSGVMLTWNKWDRPLLPVINRGTRFLPPKKHLGKPLDFYREQHGHIEEPRLVAGLAMKFYVAMVNEISKKVFEHGSTRAR